MRVFYFHFKIRQGYHDGPGLFKKKKVDAQAYLCRGPQMQITVSSAIALTKHSERTWEMGFWDAWARDKFSFDRSAPSQSQTMPQ